MLRQKPVDYTLLAISLCLYFLFAYGLKRYETFSLLVSYTALFGIFVWICAKAHDTSIQFWLCAALLFRLVFLVAIPNLSDDFYRFIWDGRLLANGYHPFAHVPSYYMETNSPVADLQLYQKLNSPDYFTVYPPVSQFVFWLAAKLAPHSIAGSVILFRIITLMAELGNLWLIKKLLLKFRLPPKNILLYAANPLIIIELTGNLHQEAMLIFFILLSLYWITREKVAAASIAHALSICIKLIPILFSPVIFFRMGWKKGFVMLLLSLLIVAILFLPLLTQDLLGGLTQSLGYYYKKFEFNSSLYYLWRQWGFWYYGHNIIQSIAWRLGAIAGAGILAYSYWRSGFSLRNPSRVLPGTVVWARLPEDYMFILLIYFLSTTTLHPWYIATMLAVSVFTPYRFVMIWTYLIFLTYSGYAADSFQENYVIVGIEYLGVLAYLTIESIKQNRVQTAS